MSLEIPNAIAAAAVLRYSSTGQLGSHFTVMSSNGLLGKESEIDVPIFNPGSFGAVFPFETPLSAEEACVACNPFAVTSGGPASSTAMVTPPPESTGIPAIDDLPENRLLVLSDYAAVAISYVSVHVLRIPRG